MILSTITFYKNSKDVLGQKYTNFDYLLDVMKNGDYGLSNSIPYLRQLLASGNIDEYKAKKQELLPMFAYSGDFSYRNSDPSNLLTYSNIVVVDFDWDNPDEQYLVNVKKWLIQNASCLHIYAVWLSPGHGIKCAIIHDSQQPEYHYNLVMQIRRDLFNDCPEFDTSCTDISRTCFMSYDPELWINPQDFPPYHFVLDPSITPPSKSNGTIHRTNGAKFQHTPEQIEQNRLFQYGCSDKTLLNMLTKSFNRQNPDYYKDGNRHSEVKKRAVIFCKDGILYDNAVWSLIGLFGENSKAGLKNCDIESMVSSCYYNASGEFGYERHQYLQIHKYNRQSNI